MGEQGDLLRRVLMVPDRLISDEMGNSFFDRHSFSVRSAQTLSAALGVAQAFRPDLIVLRSDVLDDLDLARCAGLRAAQPTAKLLLIQETVGDSDGDDYPVDARLVQPVSSEQLLNTVAALLEVRVRRGPRAYLESLVRLSGFGLPDAEEASFANAIDVSEYGMLLESAAQLELGEEGELSFFLPDSSERLRCAGVVRVALDEVLLHYACEFTDLPAPVRAALRDYVAQHGSGAQARGGLG